MSLGFGFAPGLSMAAKLTRIAVALAVMIGLMVLSYCQGRTDGKNSEIAKTQAAVIKVQKKAIAAGDVADAQRAADVARQIEAERKYEEAIEAAPGGENSPAARALACQRLRRIGQTHPNCP